MMDKKNIFSKSSLICHSIVFLSIIDSKYNLFYIKSIEMKTTFNVRKLDKNGSKNRFQ
jgi:hypothetical protein